MEITHSYRDGCGQMSPDLNLGDTVPGHDGILNNDLRTYSQCAVSRTDGGLRASKLPLLLHHAKTFSTHRCITVITVIKLKERVTQHEEIATELSSVTSLDADSPDMHRGLS